VLNFSKIKISIIYFIFLILSFFALLNIQSEGKYFNKKVNLGLDLQGGSYLLLEIFTDPLLEDRLQDKVLPLKKLLKKNQISFNNFFVGNGEIKFTISNNDNEKLKNFFFKKDKNELNPYIDKYNSYELDLSVDNNNAKVFFSKYGKLAINNAALKQSIEIIRRRIDDVGTKEPTILQRGDKRILVELPGIDNPERVKELLGKTAQLTFRLVSKDDGFGSEKLVLSENGEELTVNKRVAISGDNLVDAQPQFDSQSNQPIVIFTLDRLGAKKFGRITTENVGRRLAIVLDDSVISAPQIREAITKNKNTYIDYTIGGKIIN
jgi:protein-export membrane protein SecD